MELFMVFIFGVFAQLLLLSTAGKLDTSLPKGKKEPAKNIFGKIRNYYTAYDQKTKKSAFAYGLCVQTVSYLMIFVSMIFYLLSVVTVNVKLDATTAIVSYVLIVSGTVVFIGLLIYFLVLEIKNGKPKTNDQK